MVSQTFGSLWTPEDLGVKILAGSYTSLNSPYNFIIERRVLGSKVMGCSWVSKPLVMWPQAYLKLSSQVYTIKQQCFRGCVLPRRHDGTCEAELPWKKLSPVGLSSPLCLFPPCPHLKIMLGQVFCPLPRPTCGFNFIVFHVEFCLSSAFPLYLFMTKLFRKNLGGKKKSYNINVKGARCNSNLNKIKSLPAPTMGYPVWTQQQLNEKPEYFKKQGPTKAVHTFYI